MYIVYCDLVTPAAAAASIASVAAATECDA